MTEDLSRVWSDYILILVLTLYRNSQTNFLHQIWIYLFCSCWKITFLLLTFKISLGMLYCDMYLAEQHFLYMALSKSSSISGNIFQLFSVGDYCYTLYLNPSWSIWGFFPSSFLMLLSPRFHCHGHFGCIMWQMSRSGSHCLDSRPPWIFFTAGLMQVIAGVSIFMYGSWKLRRERRDEKHSSTSLLWLHQMKLIVDLNLKCAHGGRNKCCFFPRRSFCTWECKSIHY